MQRLEVSGAVRLIYGSLGVKGLSYNYRQNFTPNNGTICVISGFRREVGGNCALLCYYVANSGNTFTYISGQPIDPSIY